MKITVDPANPQTWPKGQVNGERLDATTESELKAQQVSDDASAMQDAAEVTHRIRQRLGSSQPGRGSSGTPGSYPSTRGKPRELN